MRKMLRPAFWCCLLALLICWTLSYTNGQQVQALAKAVGLRYGQDAGITPGAVRHAEEGAQESGGQLPEISLWEQLKEQPVKDGLGIFKNSADVLRLYGSGDDVYPTTWLSGSCPARGDASGCAVSSELAGRLWGGINVLGKQLVWEGKTYNVQGVFKSGERLVMVQEARAGHKFPYAEMKFTGAEDPMAEANGFLTKWELPHPDYWVDGPFLSLAAGLLISLPGWGLCAVVLLRLAKKALSLSRYPALMMAALVGALGLGTLIIWAAEFSIPISARFIPTKWSDFAFWGRLWEQFLSGLGSLLADARVLRNAMLLRHGALCVAFCVLALFCAVLAAERARTRSWAETAATAAAWAFSSLLLYMWLAVPGSANKLPLPVLAAAPACLLAEHYLRRLNIWLADTETANIETADVVTDNIAAKNIELEGGEDCAVGSADVETADVETADVETADVETADVETADAETADAETADAETADAEAGDDAAA